MKYYIGPWTTKTLGGRTFYSAPAGAISLLDLRSIPEHTGTNYGFFAFPNNANPGASYRQFGGTGYITEVIPIEADRAVFASMAGVPTVSGTTLMEWVASVFTQHADPTGENAVKPLVPTSTGTLEIRLAGHSVVWNKRFDVNDTGNAALIAMLKEQYRKYRIDALAGKLNGDPQFHRRILDYWGHKYRVNNPQDIFIPSNVPKETPLPHQTSISDGFNRADANSLGTADAGGWSWSEFGSEMWVINSNRARLNTVNLSTADITARADQDLSSDDHYSEVELITYSEDIGGAATVGQYIGCMPFCRKDSSTTMTWYHSELYTEKGLGSVQMYLAKTVAATGTLLDATPTNVTLSLPDLHRVSANGSTVTNYWNGVVGDSVTDTTITGNLRTGFSGYVANAAAQMVEYDSFSAADLPTTVFSHWRVRNFGNPHVGVY